MFSKPIIYVVDDEPSACQTIRALLENDGYELAFFQEGFSLLEKLKEMPPDLILLDVMMPGLNGYDVCRKIRITPAWRDIPIIMLSALDGRSDRIAGFSAGADDFISKPFDMFELRARVKMVTGLNRFRRMAINDHRLKWVIDSAEDGYLLIDENDRIQYANQAARHLLFMGEVKQIDPRPNFMELAKRQYQCYPDYNWHGWPGHLLETDRQRFMIRPETSEAEAVWLQVAIVANPVLQEGNYLLRLKNVSEKAKTQREMQSFHAVLHHKLRTPLGFTIGGLEFLRERAQLVSSDLYEMSTLALEGAKQLSQEIQEILTYLNYPVTQTTGTGLLIEATTGIVNYLQSSFDLKNTSVTVDPGLSGGRLVLSQQSVEVILWEILENAVKFHPTHHPSVTLTIRPADQRNVVIMEICSSGGQIAPQSLRHLWEPYFQDDKSRSGQIPGMGLGLSIVANIIWQSGGSYSICNNENGAGVTVALTIPLAVAPAVVQ